MKMYFYYGVMGSSKTANALMKKFNFEERGRTVALLKPSFDTRNGKTLIKSRIGLSSEAFYLDRNVSIKETLGDYKKYNTYNYHDLIKKQAVQKIREEMKDTFEEDKTFTYQRKGSPITFEAYAM